MWSQGCRNGAGAAGMAVQALAGLLFTLGGRDHAANLSGVLLGLPSFFLLLHEAPQHALFCLFEN